MKFISTQFNILMPNLANEVQEQDYSTISILNSIWKFNKWERGRSLPAIMAYVLSRAF